MVHGRGNILPDLLPNLFPFSESKQWIDKEDCQVSEVIELRRQIAAVESTAKERVREIEQKINQIKEETAYLARLLTETGESLVKAVKKTLEQLGLESVTDVDDEMKNSGVNGIKREDLRIGGNPTLLTDVLLIPERKGRERTTANSGLLKIMAEGTGLEPAYPFGRRFSRPQSGLEPDPTSLNLPI